MPGHFVAYTYAGLEKVALPVAVHPETTTKIRRIFKEDIYIDQGNYLLVANYYHNCTML